jgi:hypothetical protein
MSKLILYIVSIGILLLIVCSVWPYWNKALITSDLKSVAIYGTKHGTEDIESLLSEKMQERGYVFDSENLDIEKDEHNNVSISLTYDDKISFFGIVLKKLEFTIDVSQNYSKEIF